MGKKGLLENDFKRRKVYIKSYIRKFKYTKELKILKKLYIFGIGFPLKILKNYKIFYKFAKNNIRLQNRCWYTGKAHGYYRTFGLCRNFLKKFIGFQYIPGIVKSAW